MSSAAPMPDNAGAATWRLRSHDSGRTGDITLLAAAAFLGLLLVPFAGPPPQGTLADMNRD